MTRDQLRLRGPRVELPEAPERDRLVELRDVVDCDRLEERFEREDVAR